MSRVKPLGELQLAVMRVLWERGEATVADVHQRLHAERGQAHNTISTTLSRLEKQGLVTHRVEGRQFIYRPLVSDQQVRDAVVKDVVADLFDGDAAALVSHLLGAAAIDPDELAVMKAMIEAEEQRRGRRHAG